MTQDPSTILSNCRLFMAVKGPSLERLRKMALLKQYPQGTLVFRQGDTCPGVFIVGSGLVRIFKTSPAGKEHVLHLVAPGNTFAEVAAIGGFDCPAFAEAIEETTCALLPADSFAKALREDHQLCLGLLMSMAGWVKRHTDMVEDITLRDAAGRLARYLLNIADPNDGSIQLPSLKKHLASHLNLTSETLSRTLRRLTETGLITSSDEQELKVADREGLMALAEGDYPLL